MKGDLIMLVYILMPFEFDEIIGVFEDIDDAINLGYSRIKGESIYDEEEGVIFAVINDVKCPYYFIIEQEVVPTQPK